jgi:hypothetical protein
MAYRWTIFSVKFWPVSCCEVLRVAKLRRFNLETKLGRHIRKDKSIIFYPGFGGENRRKIAGCQSFENMIGVTSVGLKGLDTW